MAKPGYYGIYLSDLSVEEDRLVETRSTREGALKLCRLLNAEVIGHQLEDWAKLPRRVMPLYYVERIGAAAPEEAAVECTEDS
jgi:hypothetical protein